MQLGVVARREHFGHADEVECRTSVRSGELSFRGYDLSYLPNLGNGANSSTFRATSFSGVVKGHSLATRAALTKSPVSGTHGRGLVADMGPRAGLADAFAKVSAKVSDSLQRGLDNWSFRTVDSDCEPRTLDRRRLSRG